MPPWVLPQRGYTGVKLTTEKKVVKSIVYWNRGLAEYYDQLQNNGEASPPPTENPVPNDTTVSNSTPSSNESAVHSVNHSSLSNNQGAGRDVPKPGTLGCASDLLLEATPSEQEKVDNAK